MSMSGWCVGDYLPYDGRDRWQIRKILTGGMGIVYVVYDYEHREPLAAKTFQGELAALSHEVAARFIREAFAWINLDVHQNVAQARFVETIQGRPFLFLEYVSGGDLAKWIGIPYLTQDLTQVLRFAIQFCDGINHALSKHIQAHRDIKPNNCLITEDRTLKITDFGLAKPLKDVKRYDTRADGNDLNIDLTRTGSDCGTPPYMAPEQFDDAKSIEVRADIYSFGVMLFEMATGKLPFVGRSLDEFKHLHKTQLPPHFEANKELDNVIQRCLAKDPSHRFANFSMLRETLARIYEKLTGEAAPQPVRGIELDAYQLNAKGVSLGNLGQPVEEQLACYDHALTLNPRNETAWYNKAGIMLETGQLQEALASYDRALELNQRYVEAWGNRGAVLGMLGRITDAAASIERALELYPLSFRAWTNKGNVLNALGRYREAVTCFDSALAINPEHSEAWFNKGLALAERLGELHEALFCFQQAEKLGDTDAAQAVEKLRSLLGL